MTIWSRFLGDVREGKLRLRDRERFDALIRGEFDSRAVELAITEARKKRTLAQNKKIHPLARAVSNHTGDTLLAVKRLATLEALGVEHGLQSWEYKGMELRDARPTSDLSVPEASAVVEVLIGQCNFLGIPLPRWKEIEVMD